MKKKIKTIYCGIDSPTELTEDEKKRFIENMSQGGKYNVVFCEDNSIPNAMKIIAALSDKKY